MKKGEPIGERIVAIETKMDSTEQATKRQYSLLENIDRKLDNVIKTKADREEVESLRNNVEKLTMRAITTILAILISATAFLIRYTIYS